MTPSRTDDRAPVQDGPSRRRLYGRRQGRKLRPGRQRLIDELLPRLRVAVPPRAAELDPFALFEPTPREVWLEVGFGGGEHLAAQAAANPDVGFIGCEPYVNGIAALLAQVEQRGLVNVRVHDDDARDLIAALAAGSLGRVFVLFPDPWPKARHAKRRFVCPEVLAQLARVMRDGAELRVASDDAGYVRWTLAQIRRQGGFAWTAEGPEDWRCRPADWPETRYEAKAGIAGRPASYLSFRRIRDRQGEGAQMP